MKVFVLGGTGSIGTAIVAELLKRCHQVVGLSRSKASDAKLEALGAQPFRGDLSEPSGWAETAMSSAAVIQVAATFADDMGDVDAKAMSALAHAADSQSEKKRLIYTGGCWLYGETGNDIATEDRPFNPLPSFAWMVRHGEKLLSAPNLSAAIVHPAMVYHAEDGGVFRRFLSAAKAKKPIEIWGSEKTRWPIIERTDLARVYCDLVERPDLVGHFNAVAQEGVVVGNIASSISQAYSSPLKLVVRTVDEVVAENGEWAKGPMLDQQMSGKKMYHCTGWKPLVPDYRISDVLRMADIDDVPR